MIKVANIVAILIIPIITKRIPMGPTRPAEAGPTRRAGPIRWASYGGPRAALSSR